MRSPFFSAGARALIVFVVFLSETNGPAHGQLRALSSMDMFRSVWFRGSLAALSMGLSTAASARSEQPGCGGVQVLASYPNGTWLENLTQPGDGRLYYSVTSERRIDVLDSNGTPKPFAELPIYPMGLVKVGDRFIIAGNTKPLGDPSRLTTNAIVEVDSRGHVLKKVDVSAGKMFNGVLALRNGHVLVADSLGGKIFEYVPHTGVVSVWLEHPLLAPPAAGGPMAVGANGIKRYGQKLLISSSSNKTIIAVDLDGRERPKGSPRVASTPGIIDDFDVATDGTLFAAPYTTTVLRVLPSGDASPVIAGGAEGATAVSIIGQRSHPRSIYVLTTGNLLVGGKGPAQVLRVSLPTGDGECRVGGSSR